MKPKFYSQLCILHVDLSFRPDMISLTPSSDHPTFIQYTSFALTILTLVLGLVGNMVVIIITGFVVKTHKSRIWFLNLAIADFLFLLILPLNAVSVLGANWPYGQHVCKMYNFLSIANMHASIFLITALTFERFLSVMAPIWHHKFYSPRVSCCTCAAIWAVTVLSSIPAIVFSTVVEHNKKAYCSLYYSDINQYAIFKGGESSIAKLYYDAKPNATIEQAIEELHEACIWNFRDYSNKESEKIHNILQTSAKHFLLPLLSVGYFIPLCVILFCNVAIACKVRSSGKIASSKLYAMVTAAVMAFFITRTPFMVAQVITLVCLQEINLTQVTKVLFVSPLLSSIANLNCCLNPFIYVFLGREVMSVFARFFHRIRDRNRNTSSVPVTSK